MRSVRPILLVGLIATVLVAVAGYAGLGRLDRARAGDDTCNWASDTADRVFVAREALYPSDRPGASTRSVGEDAQLLFDLSVEQQNADRPEIAEELNGDLVEAFSVGAAGLDAAATGASTGADPEIQLTFAKAIVYNADARLVLAAEGC